MLKMIAEEHAFICVLLKETLNALIYLLVVELILI
jgi:hypothetical protein